MRNDYTREVAGGGRIGTAYTGHVWVTLLLAVALCVTAKASHSQSNDAGYTEVFYTSGDLRIQAYLYKPAGGGPFPAVIYNHGSRMGKEQDSVPFQYIGRLLTRAGYAVLVPERRGYGKSDGSQGFNYTEAVPRLQAETDDVLAAVDYLRTVPFVDGKRLGIMGWSFGGIVTMFAISRSGAFAVAVDQAGGALTWPKNAMVRSALTAAAEKATTPTLFLVAENDNTTDSITTLAKIYQQRGIPHRMVIYPPFIAENRNASRAPGHKLFSASGVKVWEKDVLAFLDRYLGAASAETAGAAPPAKPRR